MPRTSQSPTTSLQESPSIHDAAELLVRLRPLLGYPVAGLECTESAPPDSAEVILPPREKMAASPIRCCSSALGSSGEPILIFRGGRISAVPSSCSSARLVRREVTDESGSGTPKLVRREGVDDELRE